jgi:hypothetical protein
MQGLHSGPAPLMYRCTTFHATVTPLVCRRNPFLQQRNSFDAGCDPLDAGLYPLYSRRNPLVCCRDLFDQILNTLLQWLNCFLPLWNPLLS